MLKRLSSELVHALSTRMLLYEDENEHYISHDIGDIIGVVHLEQLTEKRLIDECMEWRRIIDTYFKMSYRAMSLKRAGRYLNLRPLKYEKPKTKTKRQYVTSIKFQIEFVDQQSWKDWFITEGELNAP